MLQEFKASVPDPAAAFKNSQDSVGDEKVKGPDVKIAVPTAEAKDTVKVSAPVFNDGGLRDDPGYLLGMAILQSGSLIPHDVPVTLAKNQLVLKAYLEKAEQDKVVEDCMEEQRTPGVPGPRSPGVFNSPGVHESCGPGNNSGPEMLGEVARRLFHSPASEGNPPDITPPLGGTTSSVASVHNLLKAWIRSSPSSPPQSPASSIPPSPTSPTSEEPEEPETRANLADLEDMFFDIRSEFFRLQHATFKTQQRRHAAHMGFRYRRRVAARLKNLSHDLPPLTSQMQVMKAEMHKVCYQNQQMADTVKRAQMDIKVVKTMYAKRWQLANHVLQDAFREMHHLRATVAMLSGRPIPTGMDKHVLEVPTSPACRPSGVQEFSIPGVHPP